MKILATVKKIPGGLMAIPLILGVFFNTFFPSVLQIGSFTTDLWYAGAMPILAVFLFCNGAQINVKQAAAPLAKGLAFWSINFAAPPVFGGLPLLL